ncbi:MAG: hypothetical protein IKL31_02200 [Ruminococcus sp.]|nr:hypothetical protein [Ruminococcus sp.]MBR6669542.1 hypothetical protein [Ruminococcus sp.]
MKNKKTAFMAVMMYILLTSGVWGILNAYSISYNKLSPKKIKPVSLKVNSQEAEIEILEKSYNLNIKNLQSESKVYYVLYLLSSDEARWTGIFLASVID